MENIITILDTGLETPGMLESLNSQIDITLTNISLSDSPIREMSNNDINCQELASNSSDKSHAQMIKRSTSMNSPTSGTSTGKDDQKLNRSLFSEINNTSTKEEKQRHNEEIVILESSSLSSETGSWESVFPPKLSDKELCVKFIANELKNAFEGETKKINNSTKQTDDLCPSLVKKSPYKSTSCFIDAASLADECGEMLTVQTVIKDINNCSEQNQSTLKRDLSPSDWSGSNDNEDSLEQSDNLDPDSILKYISPIKCEMPFITENTSGSLHSCEPDHIEDSLPQEKVFPGNGFVQIRRIAEGNSTTDTTPNNSIETVRYCSNSRLDKDLSTSNMYCSTLHTSELSSQLKSSALCYTTCLSQMEDANSTSFNENHISLNDLSVRRQVENKPIVSGAYIPEPEHVLERTQKAPSSSSFWVVDMSSDSIQNDSHSKLNSEPVDELRSTSKSENRKNGKGRSSVDSDSSEKSTHNFYIDFAKLPEVLTPIQKQDKDEGSEKKNIFSMFVGLDDDSTTAKEIPVRFHSSIPYKKNTRADTKHSKSPKVSESKNYKLVTNTRQPTDDNVLFEKLETLCNDPTISITEIINKQDISVMYNDLKNKVIEEEPAAQEPVDLFVKLSDLDKPAQKADPVTNSKNIEYKRMTRSIPDNDWKESSQTIDIRSSEIISSFHSENALSLNRLFPNLKSDLSKSMPGSLSSRTRSPLRHGVSSSPGDINEHQVSDVSEMSSVQSSCCRSVVENSTTEETEQTSSLINNCQSRLGQDLLRMFLEEIAPDVIVEVSGRRIRAHKCILSSRCQYFAGILSGGWVESAGNVISLPQFRFSVVHFTLCHIYSGISVIPDSINIVELATLADMLGLEGLKEGIMFMLKTKYCHEFHKPCELCIAGVLHCLTLSSVCGLDDLYRKCMRWVTKYFRQVWPTKAFATIPSMLIEKCYHEQIINLSAENLIDTVYGCGIIMWSLSNSRWAEVVARICRRLLNASAQFVSTHLCDVLSAMHSTEVPVELPPAATQSLQDCLKIALDRASVEETCRAYKMVSPLDKDARAQRFNEDGSTAPRSLLVEHAISLRVLCERSLVRNGPRIANTTACAELPEDLRCRLRSLGFVTCDLPFTGRSPRTPRRPRAEPAATTGSARSLDFDLARPRRLPYTRARDSHLGSVDSLTARDKTVPSRTPKPRDDRPSSKILRIHPPSVRTTKAQEERAKYNSIKTNKSAERQMSVSLRTAYEHTKPRYMEPRQSREKPPAPTVRKSLAKNVSSSDSSRNSSPVLASKRSPRPRPRVALRSTADSLLDKYATYTITKHNMEGSIEAVISPAASQSTQPSNTRSLPVTVPNGKNKPTKIPVFTNKTTKLIAAPKETQRRVQSVAKSHSPILQRTKPIERKSSGSLMNATKSSQAKVVSKTLKETTNTRHSLNPDRNQEEKGSTSKEAAVRSPEIPIMERSGTFLKDEPTLDITKNIDIDE